MRSVPEWVADHDDQAIPARVKARILLRYNGRCALTGIKLMPGDIDFDHIKSLRNGGAHRESNLQPVYRPAHREKTTQENSEARRPIGSSPSITACGASRKTRSARKASAILGGLQRESRTTRGSDGRGELYA